ncbi:acyl carrier protein [Lentzea sp. BCCO 10_0798]|uniref:Acyl carrier protein n=1 Tax=Lentzea kristufekii TaxID=3095430 RepID=A0ABU4TQI9_9PSEU|nr:acyl carrier protein [Lentzea sp. BCCO 10_0798]MDX8050187.1 acyl carrier protein [Lentzea sp. BCCO 10_0798]
MTEQETQLCDLFADILGVPGIDPLDNFFDLGGHSLLASKLVKQVHERFGVRISLRSFYENPTAGAVAKHVDQAA